MSRRLLCLTLMICLLAGGAQAAFSPGLHHWAEGYAQGQALRLDLTASLDSLADAPDSVLRTFQTWLQRLSVRMWTGQSTVAASVLLDGAEALGLQTWDEGESQVLALTPSGAAWTGRDPLQQLLCIPATVPDLRRPQAALSALWRDLAPQGARSKQASAIKNLGTARERISYPLDEASWQRLYAALSDTLGELGITLPEARLEEAGSLQRLLDAEGQDLGLRLTGRLLVEGQSRRLSLLAGWRANKGLYIDLKLPAVKGRDSLTLRVSGTFTERAGERRWQADWVQDWRLGSERGAGSGRLTLSSRDSEGGERLSGSLRLDQRPGQGPPSRLTLTPELVLSEGLLSGTVGITKSLDGKPALAWTLHPSLRLEAAPGQPPAEPTALKGLDPAALSLERERALGALMAPLLALTQDLPEDSYWQALHYLGRDLWTQGDSAAPIAAQDTDPDGYVVQDTIEEEDP